MAGLQRSAVSFRRQGSSGLVWDDKFLSGELNQLAEQQKQIKNDTKSHQKQRKENSASTAATYSSPSSVGVTIERSRSNGGRRTGRVSPAIEPPSPRVTACGFCNAFGKQKSNKTRRRPPKSGKRVM